MSRTVTARLLETNYVSLEEMMEAINSVPEEYRDTIHFEAEEFYYPYDSSPSKRIVLEFQRPENEEEKDKRLVEERERQRIREERDLKEFNRLQEKYGQS